MSTEKYLGELVIIRWNSSFLYRNNRDTIDPDSWSDTGFVAQSNDDEEIFCLLYHPSSFEYYSKGITATPDFDDNDVDNIIRSSCSSLSLQDLKQPSFDFLTRYNFSIFSNPPNFSSSNGFSLPNCSSGNCSSGSCSSSYGNQSGGCSSGGCNSPASSCVKPEVKSCNTCKNYSFLSDFCDIKKMRVSSKNVCDKWVG
jgi:hypothetical protein